MIWLDGAKASVILFLAVVLQIAVASEIDVFGGEPDLLLVALVAVALLRGAVYGAVAGFCAGLLADMGTFGTLGFMSLLFTLAGYWIGRYGETTGHDRSHAPVVSVAVVTVLFAFGALALHFMLGQNAPARAVLVESLFPSLLLNLLLAVPVYALVRRVLRPVDVGSRTPEVRLLG